ncbi:mediator of RNA polymerase II transcription subunit 25-like isoform X3 [Zingiber officinale]|uniref:mediator of RNA polymerase II transcription subunit 25-like isoform X3 n=1 Tax=Zingiber officinale TaxID=94328 RepID=UPI001C4B67AB|nr:mediator of RNA polymerase II transcription subunit 25-like isoform X3 [Zingiber officinale]
MAEKQLIVVVEGTAALGPYWQTIRNDYLEKIIRCYYGNELTGQKLNGTNPEFALVVFNTHGPYNDIVVQRSGWTKDLDIFLQWLSTMCFSGGGFSEAAIAEGLSEALMMLLVSINASDNHQSPEVQKHCVLVAASNPYPLPTPVYRPPISSLEHKENTEVQKESFLADAETVAKSFSQCFVSLSVISPKQLPKLRSIYNAGKKNPHAADPSVDHVRNPNFLVLLSESFVEACAALSRTLLPNQSISSQGIGKIDGSSTVPISGLPATANPSVNGTIMPRQPITVGSIPTATVKVEPATVSSMVSGPGFSHISSITNVPSQGVSNLQNSSPSHSSQEMNANIDTTQEIKPLLNPLSQPLRPAVPAPANVNILNTISQHRTPVAVHMSNMISSGMASSAHSAISSVSGSGQPMAVTQVTQNSPLGSLASVTSNLGGNSSIGIPPTLNTLQGNMTIGLSASNVGQGTLTSGAQISQVGITINQNMMNNLVSSSVSSGPGTMIPTPGMSQQAGSHSLEIANNTAINMPLVQQTSNIQQSQSKYVKIWEGQLSGQRQGQPVFICRLEVSFGFLFMVIEVKQHQTLAADWPSVMQIVRLIAQEHMNNKQYVGNADFLVFRTLNQHGFLGQLQEKKLCAVIQLPSQTLLLSVSDKAGRLIGMLFPGDMVVFKPQVPSQQQQLQQLQPQSQSHLHLQQQHMQQQQLQQQAQQHQHLQVQQPAQQQQQQQPQQIVGAGISQTFIQGHGRSQIMTQGRLPQAGPTNLPGGFLP